MVSLPSWTEGVINRNNLFEYHPRKVDGDLITTRNECLKISVFRSYYINLEIPNKPLGTIRCINRVASVKMPLVPKFGEKLLLFIWNLELIMSAIQFHC